MCRKLCGIAESAAGHDKGRLYAVTDKRDGTVFLADGRRRKLSSPKKKNAKHVIFLPDGEFEAVSGKTGERMTDAALRRMLAAARARRKYADNDQGGT